MTITNQKAQNIRSLSAISTNYWATEILDLSVHLDIFAKHKTYLLTDLQSKTNLPNNSLRLLLRALCVMRLLHYKNCKYDITSKGSLFQTDSYPNFLNVVKMWKEQRDVWKWSAIGLKVGREQFSKTAGKPFFAWVSEDKNRARLYSNAMHVYAQIDYIFLPTYYQFRNVERILNLVGGTGSLLEILYNSNPKLNLALFDLDVPVELAKNRLGKISIIEYYVGDMFVDPIPHSDVIILSRIIHVWNDEKSIEILKKCKNSLKPDGRILIIEKVLPYNENHAWGVFLNLHLLFTVGGQERTILEYEHLFTNAGFSLSEVVEMCETGISIVEAR